MSTTSRFNARFQGPVSIIYVSRDDEDGLSNAVETGLTSEFEQPDITTVSDCERVLTEVENGTVDCIISKFELSGIDGISLLQQVREIDSDVPYILFVSAGSEEIASEAISAGVTDYVRDVGSSDQQMVLANRVANAVQMHRAEKRVETVEEKAALVSTFQSDGCWEYDVESGTLWLSDSFQRQFNADVQVIEDGSQWVIDCIHPDDQETVKRRVEDAVITGESCVDVEARLQTGDDEYVQCLTHISIMRDDDGDPVTLIGAVSDLSEKKKRDNRLRLLERVVESAGHSVYATTNTGVITYVNPAFEEQTGYTAAEAIGKTPRILKSGVHDEPFYAELWDTVLSGDVWRNEIINETKSGERYVVDQTIAPVKSDDGEVTDLVAINIDVTDKYRYERSLEEQNQRLKEFAGVVSHDLRNPLSVAKGRLHMVKQECDSEHLDDVTQAHDRMETLIEKLLTLTRKGVNDQPTVDLPVQDLVESCWENTATRDATLNVETDCVVTGDMNRLKQLITNVLRNAIDHVGPSVTITVGDLDGDDGFYIEDDGPGIPDAEKETVFDAGYTTADDGTGLGLNIVKQVVDEHNWEIHVTDAPSGGVRFEIIVS